MRTFIQKICMVAYLVASLAPLIASANVSAVSPSFSCSRNLTVSFENGYQASCDGDFLFTDGILQNDTFIRLIAGGILDVGVNASLIAPNISLSGSNVILNGVLEAAGGNISISASSSLIVGTTAKLDVGNVNTLIGNLGSEGSGAVISTGDIFITNPTKPALIIGLSDALPVNAGGDITLVGSVPEPSVYLLLLLGLTSVGFVSRKQCTKS
ncbi:MAG: PEP-CTERM sorting domain-containing protein [Methylophilus sp.]|nr:PEP-CTERM sorting domain-containing protein [Methylophilus sp.]